MNEILGDLVTLKLHPTTPVAVGQCLKLTIPGITRETPDNTVLGSGGWTTCSAGIKSGGACKGTLIYHPTNHTTLVGYMLSGELVKIEIPLDDVETWKASGRFKSFQVGDAESKTAFLTADFEITVSGEVEVEAIEEE